MAHAYMNFTIQRMQRMQSYGNRVLPIDLTTTCISDQIPKGKFILHDILFNMATGIQIKFHQDIIMTHILMTMNVTLKRSVVLRYLKTDKKVTQYIQYDYDIYILSDTFLPNTA